jgi:hypothetical protein
MLTLPTTPPTHPMGSPSLRPLSTRWHLLKTRATHPQLLVLWSAELFFLTFLLYVLASTMHAVVQCFDVLYALLGRQARSPFVAGGLLGSVGVAVSVVFVGAWSLWLGRLSYCAVFDGVEEKREGEEEEEGEGQGQGHGQGEKARKGVSWGRVLGRLVVPLFLVGSMLRFVYVVAERVAEPLPFITANTDLTHDLGRLANAASSS